MVVAGVVALVELDAVDADGRALGDEDAVVERALAEREGDGIVLNLALGGERAAVGPGGGDLDGGVEPADVIGGEELVREAFLELAEALGRYLPGGDGVFGRHEDAVHVYGRVRGGGDVNLILLGRGEAREQLDARDGEVGEAEAGVAVLRQLVDPLTRQTSLPPAETR